MSVEYGIDDVVAGRFSSDPQRGKFSVKVTNRYVQSARGRRPQRPAFSGLLTVPRDDGTRGAWGYDDEVESVGRAEIEVLREAVACFASCVSELDEAGFLVLAQIAREAHEAMPREGQDTEGRSE